MQKLEQFILVYYSLLFLGFGIAAMILPDTMSGLVHFGLTNAVANIEYMATYGGLFIGLAFYMLYCVTGNAVSGLVCVLLTMGGMFIARITGYLLYKDLDTLQGIYLAGELFTMVLIALVLCKGKKIHAS